MSNPIILKYSEFDAKNLVFSEIKKNKFGGKKVYIKYDNPKLDRTHELYIQLPEMTVPFGINENEKKEGESVVGYTYSVSFSLNGESSENIALCEKNLTKFDDRVKLECKNNVKSWLSKKEIVDVINDEIYKSTVRKPKDNFDDPEARVYPNTLRATMYKDQKTIVPGDLRSGEFQCDAFMGTGEYEKIGTRKREKIEKVDITENLKKGSRVVAIIKCNGVWFGFGGYGVSWSIVQMQIKPNEKLSGFAIMQDSEDEESFEASDEESFEAETPEEAIIKPKPSVQQIKIIPK